MLQPYYSAPSCQRLTLAYLLAEGKNKGMACDTPIVSMILALIIYTSPTFPLHRRQKAV